MTLHHGSEPGAGWGDHHSPYPPSSSPHRDHTSHSPRGFTACRHTTEEDMGRALLSALSSSRSQKADNSNSSGSHSVTEGRWVIARVPRKWDAGAYTPGNLVHHTATQDYQVRITADVLAAAGMDSSELKPGDNVSVKIVLRTDQSPHSNRAFKYEACAIDSELAFTSLRASPERTRTPSLTSISSPSCSSTATTTTPNTTTDPCTDMHAPPAAASENADVKLHLDANDAPWVYARVPRKWDPHSEMPGHLVRRTPEQDYQVRVTTALMRSCGVDPDAVRPGDGVELQLIEVTDVSNVAFKFHAAAIRLSTRGDKPSIPPTTSITATTSNHLHITFLKHTRTLSEDELIGIYHHHHAATTASPSSLSSSTIDEENEEWLPARVPQKWDPLSLKCGNLVCKLPGGKTFQVAVAAATLLAAGLTPSEVKPADTLFVVLEERIPLPGRIIQEVFKYRAKAIRYLPDGSTPTPSSTRQRARSLSTSTPTSTLTATSDTDIEDHPPKATSPTSTSAPSVASSASSSSTSGTAQASSTVDGVAKWTALSQTLRGVITPATVVADAPLTNRRCRVESGSGTVGVGVEAMERVCVVEEEEMVVMGKEYRQEREDVDQEAMVVDVKQKGGATEGHGETEDAVVIVKDKQQQQYATPSASYATVKKSPAHHTEEEHDQGKGVSADLALKHPATHTEAAHVYVDEPADKIPAMAAYTRPANLLPPPQQQQQQQQQHDQHRQQQQQQHQELYSVHSVVGHNAAARADHVNRPHGHYIQDTTHPRLQQQQQQHMAAVVPVPICAASTSSFAHVGLPTPPPPAPSTTPLHAPFPYNPNRTACTPTMAPTATTTHTHTPANNTHIDLDWLDAVAHIGPDGGAVCIGAVGELHIPPGALDRVTEVKLRARVPTAAEYEAAALAAESHPSSHPTRLLLPTFQCLPLGVTLRREALLCVHLGLMDISERDRPDVLAHTRVRVCHTHPYTHDEARRWEWMPSADHYLDLQNDVRGLGAVLVVPVRHLATYLPTVDIPAHCSIPDADIDSQPLHAIVSWSPPLVVGGVKPVEVWVTRAHARAAILAGSVHGCSSMNVQDNIIRTRKGQVTLAYGGGGQTCGGNGGSSGGGDGGGVQTAQQTHDMRTVLLPRPPSSLVHFSSRVRNTLYARATLYVMPTAVEDVTLQLDLSTHEGRYVKVPLGTPEYEKKGDDSAALAAMEKHVVGAMRGLQGEMHMLLSSASSHALDNARRKGIFTDTLRSLMTQLLDALTSYFTATTRAVAIGVVLWSLRRVTKELARCLHRHHLGDPTCHAKPEDVTKAVRTSMADKAWSLPWADAADRIFDRCNAERHPPLPSNATADRYLTHATSSATLADLREVMTVTLVEISYIPVVALPTPHFIPVAITPDLQSVMPHPPAHIFPAAHVHAHAHAHVQAHVQAHMVQAPTHHLHYSHPQQQHHQQQPHLQQHPHKQPLPPSQQQPHHVLPQHTNTHTLAHTHVRTRPPVPASVTPTPTPTPPPPTPSPAPTTPQRPTATTTQMSTPIVEVTTDKIAKAVACASRSRGPPPNAANTPCPYAAAGRCDFGPGRCWYMHE